MKLIHKLAFTTSTRIAMATNRQVVIALGQTPRHLDSTTLVNNHPITLTKQTLDLFKICTITDRKLLRGSQLKSAPLETEPTYSKIISSYPSRVEHRHQE